MQNLDIKGIIINLSFLFLKKYFPNEVENFKCILPGLETLPVKVLSLKPMNTFSLGFDYTQDRIPIIVTQAIGLVCQALEHAQTTVNKAKFKNGNRITKILKKHKIELDVQHPRLFRCLVEFLSEVEVSDKGILLDDFQEYTWILNTDTKRIKFKYSETEIILSDREFGVLKKLIDNQGNLVPYEEFHKDTSIYTPKKFKLSEDYYFLKFDKEFPNAFETLRETIKTLRDKLFPKSVRKTIIVNVKSRGYFFSESLLILKRDNKIYVNQ